MSIFRILLGGILILVIGILILVSRFIKYVLPTLLALLIVFWIPFILQHLIADTPLINSKGIEITLKDLFFGTIVKAGLLGLILFYLGEGLIRFNEYLAKPLFKHEEEDPHKM